VFIAPIFNEKRLKKKLLANEQVIAKKKAITILKVKTKPVIIIQSQ